MKIVHIAPNSPYNDYWGYQDNLLPKYQKKLGHDVTVLVSNKEHDNGQIVEGLAREYDLSDGQHIVRIPYKRYLTDMLTNLHSYMPVYHKLVEFHPDFIFFHGLVSDSIFDAIRYKENVNPDCVIVQDNHADYNIGNASDTLKKKILRYYYRRKNKKSIKYVDKVYGVTPWRKAYAEDYYQIPASKTDVLIMGADDEKLDFEHQNDYRERIRSQYGIIEEDFLIVTGGKIDRKKKIDILMEACCGKTGVKLLVFGNIADDIKDKFSQLIKENENIIYIGWINSNDVYQYFFASDLVFFPGQHSVLWEQACAAKVPCVFEKWDGMDHVDIGGNSDFVSPVCVETVSSKIDEVHYTEKYYKMREIAKSERTNVFLYSKIAKKSLECVDN